MRVKLTDRLVETYNLEKINIGNGEELAYRIEIFKSEETIKCYSFRLLRGDFYSLVDSFNNELAELLRTTLTPRRPVTLPAIMPSHNECNTTHPFALVVRVLE